MSTPVHGRAACARSCHRAVDPRRGAQRVQRDRPPRRLPGARSFMRDGRLELRRLHARAPTTAQQDWMRAHYWRMRAYSPYFDSRLSLGARRRGCTRDAYAIYVGGPVARHASRLDPARRGGQQALHPLRLQGRHLPAVRGRHRQPGLPGVVDLARRAPSSRAATPASTSTTSTSTARSATAPGRRSTRSTRAPAPSMTEADWQRYLADYMAGRPRRVPDDGDRPQRRSGSPATPRPTSCACCAPPTSSTSSAASTTPASPGGTGKWSLQRAAGLRRPPPRRGPRRRPRRPRRPPPPGRLYGLAAYFLISSGRDGIGNASGGTPADWWTGYDVDLGAPLGAPLHLRTASSAATSSAASCSSTSPARPPARVALPAGARDLTGAAEHSVTLPAASGAVFVTAAPPAVTATATFTVPKPQAALSASVPRVATAASAAPAAAARRDRPGAAAQGLGPAAARGGRHVRISGRLAGARRGRVDIVLRRAHGGVGAGACGSAARNGRFVRTLRRVRPARTGSP